MGGGGGGVVGAALAFKDQHICVGCIAVASQGPALLCRSHCCCQAGASTPV